jgi:hypothetical protein
MGWVKSFVLISLFMLCLSFAMVTIPFGDNGASFAANTSAAMCNSSDVQAVYTCIGNVVRVVSSVPGEGNTFYKPDGRVVACPIAAPTKIGGECVQLLMPNFCGVETVCGNSTAIPQVFPGQNDSAEQSGNATYYIIPGQAASDQKNDTVAVVSPPQQKTPPKKEVVATVVKNEIQMPAENTTGKLDSVLGYLSYVILFLGILTVAVLFMLFRNSLEEDEKSI